MRKTLFMSMMLYSSLFFISSSYAAAHHDDCCRGMGGVRYCDSSAGRKVCNNGYYSSCYCSKTAVMDLQFVSGCCLWQGGVLKVDPLGLVICADGSVSPICSSISASQKAAAW